MKADFSKIIKDSIQITKSNKRLWVMGLVLATLTAGSGFSGGGGGGGSSRDSTPSKPDNSVERGTPAEDGDSKLLNSNLLGATLPQVLGTATSTFSTLKDVVKMIPTTFYIALVLLILVSIALGTAIAMYGRGWSQSGLIHGINKQSAGEILTLGQMSDHGKLNAVEVIKIQLIPGLILIVVTVVLGGVLAIPALLLGSMGTVITVLLGIVYGVIVITAFIIVSASVNLGVYAINLESLKWKEGFKRGHSVFKKYFLDVFVMSFINCCAGCLVGVVTLIGIGLLGGIGVASVVGAVAVPPLLILAGPVVFLALLAIIMLTGTINAIFTVFKQSTWVLLYKQLTEETVIGQ